MTIREPLYGVMIVRVFRFLWRFPKLRNNLRNIAAELTNFVNRTF